jgi:transposase
VHPAGALRLCLTRRVQAGSRFAEGMAMTIRVRALDDGEAQALAHMTRSRTLGAGLVRRAQIVQHAVDGLSAPEIAAKMALCGATVRFWLKRFNARGLPGLEEDRRSGRPATYSPEERSAVITAALSRPADLGLPFACWTLDRLVAYLSERGIGMKRSRISEVLLAEGLTWRQEETWFGARVDPEFTRKRGRLSSSTPRRPRAASSSASTRWDPLPARATRANA